MSWWTQDIESVLKSLDSSAEGLSSAQARDRLQEHGYNQLEEKKPRSAFSMFLDQFKDFMIMVLIAAAVISSVIGELIDTLAIIVIVVLNAVIGFIQEYRADRAIRALKTLATPLATVLRDGHRTTIVSREIVPGDVVFLETGNIVPADLRLIEAVQLKIEEASLTGESVPVEKITGPLKEEHLLLGDRRNMAFKGTTVSYGRGRGIAVATGMKTEIGRIAAMLQEEDVKTPLQKRLQNFGQKLALAVLVICAIVFASGLLRGEEILMMLLTSISLAVAAIPEALPAVITIALALGARRMVRVNALIRKLPAVETLGSVTYICSDKTGTITLNKMTVEKCWVDGQIFSRDDFRTSSERRLKPWSNFSSGVIDLNQLSPQDLMLIALALSNDAHVDRNNKVQGDPTEVALLEFARQNSFEKTELEKYFPRVAEVPFDPDRKLMTTIHRCPGDVGYISFTKGAVEMLLDCSSRLRVSAGEMALDKKVVIGVNEEMAAAGLRVLGFAFNILPEIPSPLEPGNVEANLAFIGLLAMIDPPREEVFEAVASCWKAGIKPVMITGDHPLTAKAIAKRIGIIEDEGDILLTGQDLDRLSLDDLEKDVEKIKVYARVAPDQKLKIVRALQDKGQFVAMTGDGVNDAPALKMADIGVAMGITGTDVAKEAADMVLLDDNFATIVKAVREGRRIFDNIRKFIKYTMSSNSGEIWTIFLAPFLGLPIPLLPIHILWINLVTDGLPGLALAVEPPEKDVMERPPRNPRESIFSHGLARSIIWIGLLMAAVTLFVQAFSIKTGLGNWQTMAFTVLCLSQVGNALAVRSEKESFFRLGILSNKTMIFSVFLTLILQLMIIYLPFLNRVFKTAPLSPGELIFVLLMSSIVFCAVELEKYLRRRRTEGLASRCHLDSRF